MKTLSLLIIALAACGANTNSEPTADGGVVLAEQSCETTQAQALTILKTNCAKCHGGSTPGARQGTPPFAVILDVNALKARVSSTAKDQDTGEPSRFLVPGDPEHSRIYLRPYYGEMPPPDIIGLPAYPRPNANELAILHAWIENCVE